MSLRLSAVHRLTSRAREQARARNRRRRLWALEALEGRVLLSGNPTYYTVNLTSDTGASSGTDAYPTAGTPSGDLLWAITQANANTNPAGSVINFDNPNAGGPNFITLSNTLDLSEQPGPEVIEAPAAGVEVSAVNVGSSPGPVQVFNVSSGTTASFSGLIIARGHATDGGGIYNAGSLALTGCTLAADTASEDGGAIYNAGTLNVCDSTIASTNEVVDVGFVGGSELYVNSNSAIEGGGIYNTASGTVTVTGSTIGGLFGVGSENTADQGGGIYNDGGSVTVTGSNLTESLATGDPNAEPPVPADGGGIYSAGGSLTIEGGSAIIGNVASNGAAQNPQGDGGGVYNSGATLIISDSSIDGSSAGQGGGVYNVGATGITDTITGSTIGGSAYEGGGIVNDGAALNVSGSSIEYSSATIGAGVENKDGGDLTITDSTIAVNSAVFGGGIQNTSGSCVTIEGNSLISDNTVASDNHAAGGGIDNSGKLIVDDSTVSENVAKGILYNGGDQGTANGGGIENESSGVLHINNSTVAQNEAFSFSAAGGYGGGIDNNNQVFAVGVTVEGNTAQYGGGIENEPNGSLNISDSTISYNSATAVTGEATPSYAGGGIDDQGTLIATNSTFAGNLAFFGGGISVRSGTLTAINDTIAYNNISYDNVDASNSGGGVYTSGTGTAGLYNTIVAVNTVLLPTFPLTTESDDVGGNGITSTSSNNLVGTDESGTVKHSIDCIVVDSANPGLGMLADNGGPTQTIAVLSFNQRRPQRRQFHAHNPRRPAGTNHRPAQRLARELRVECRHDTGHRRLRGQLVVSGHVDRRLLLWGWISNLRCRLVAVGGSLGQRKHQRQRGQSRNPAAQYDRVRHGGCLRLSPDNHACAKPRHAGAIQRQHPGGHRWSGTQAAHDQWRQRGLRVSG